MFEAKAFPLPEGDKIGALSTKTIELPCGTPLCVYQNRHEPGLPYVVFANGLGVRGEFVEPLARRLQGEANLVTWDYRFLPGPGVGDFKNTKVDDHAKDLLFVMDHFEIDRAYHIGYCSGAEVSLRSSIISPSRVKGVLLLSGAYSLRNPVLSADEKNLEGMFKTLVEKPELTELYFNLMQTRRTPANDQNSSEENRVDNKIQEILDFPYRFDFEKLNRFAVMANNFLTNNIEDWVCQVDVPCLAFYVKDDKVSHYSQTQEISKLIKNCRLQEFSDDGQPLGHYAIYRNKNAIEFVAQAVVSAG